MKITDKSMGSVLISSQMVLESALSANEQDKRIKALEKMLRRLCRVYRDMQDGNGNPCPDIKRALALLGYKS